MDNLAQHGYPFIAISTIANRDLVRFLVRLIPYNLLVATKLWRIAADQWLAHPPAATSRPDPIRPSHYPITSTPDPAPSTPNHAPFTLRPTTLPLRRGYYQTQSSHFVTGPGQPFFDKNTSIERLSHIIGIAFLLPQFGNGRQQGLWILVGVTQLADIPAP